MPPATMLTSSPRPWAAHRRAEPCSWSLPPAQLKRVVLVRGRHRHRHRFSPQPDYRAEILSDLGGRSRSRGLLCFITASDRNCARVESEWGYRTPSRTMSDVPMRWAHLDADRVFPIAKQIICSSITWLGPGANHFPVRSQIAGAGVRVVMRLAGSKKGGGGGGGDPAVPPSLHSYLEKLRILLRDFRPTRSRPRPCSRCDRRQAGSATSIGAFVRRLITIFDDRPDVQFQRPWAESSSHVPRKNLSHWPEWMLG